MNSFFDSNSEDSRKEVNELTTVVKDRQIVEMLQKWEQTNEWVKFGLEKRKPDNTV